MNDTLLSPSLHPIHWTVQDLITMFTSPVAVYHLDNVSNGQKIRTLYNAQYSGQNLNNLTGYQEYLELIPYLLLPQESESSSVRSELYTIIKITVLL